LIKRDRPRFKDNEVILLELTLSIEFLVSKKSSIWNKSIKGNRNEKKYFADKFVDCCGWECVRRQYQNKAGETTVLRKRQV